PVSKALSVYPPRCAMNRFLAALLIVFGTAAPSWAYIAALPTLGKVVADSDQIMVLRVDKVSREKQVVLFTKVADLKGKAQGDEVTDKVTAGSPPRQAGTVLDWAEPGAIAVCFQRGNVSQTCIGRFWYECAAGEAGWWTMTRSKPELCYAYSGSTAKL